VARKKIVVILSLGLLLVALDFGHRLLKPEIAKVKVTFPLGLRFLAHSFDLQLVSDHPACFNFNRHITQQNLDRDTLVLEYFVNTACGYNVAVNLYDDLGRLIYSNRVPANKGLVVKGRAIENEQDLEIKLYRTEFAEPGMPLTVELIASGEIHLAEKRTEY
jgi:hypothetical protein